MKFEGSFARRWYFFKRQYMTPLIIYKPAMFERPCRVQWSLQCCRVVFLFCIHYYFACKFPTQLQELKQCYRNIQVRDVHRQKMPRHRWTNDESHLPTHCTDDIRWFHCQQILQTNTPNFIRMRWTAIHLPSSNTFTEPIFWMPPMKQWLSFEPKFVWKDQKNFLWANLCYGQYRSYSS